MVLKALQSIKAYLDGLKMIQSTKISNYTERMRGLGRQVGMEKSASTPQF